MIVTAPCAGWVGPLADVPDPVFADGMMGAGVMIDPVDGIIVAPCDATVIARAASGHSVTLRLANGAELLIHVGIDTVALGGRGFAALVEAGAGVSKGDPLIGCDLDAIARAGCSLRTPIIVINDGFVVAPLETGRMVAAGDPLFTVVSETGVSTVAAADTAARIAEVAVPLAHGLHARPSARLAAIVRGHDADATVLCGPRSANGASVAALMALGASLGDTLRIEARGADAEVLLAAMIAAIESGLGEQPAAIAAPVGEEVSAAVAVAPALLLDGSEVLAGVTGAAGIVIGMVRQLRAAQAALDRPAGSPIDERSALDAARTAAAARLHALEDEASLAQRDILAAHRALLDDPDLAARADGEIAAGASAAQAWRAACRAAAAALATLDNARLRERGEDLLDVERQVLTMLAGGAEAGERYPANTIVVAEALLPTEFLDCAARGAAAICTVGGGATSHVSILAGGMGIPALVAADPRVRLIPDGTAAILDGDRATLHVAPTETARQDLATRIADRRRFHDEAVGRAAEPAATRDGTRILVLANLGDPGGTPGAVKAGAEGCGLLRSEFLFLDRAAPPDEAEQRRQYQAIADALPEGAPLVIRTLDIGGDKPVPFLDMPAEENPALGLRGMRLSLRHPELLRTQLRAILGVTGARGVQTMLPMVIDAEELRAARIIFEEERAAAGLDDAPLGVMVETPAAALLADTLAPHADFFSIGTNDLTQYALAIDRGSVPLARQVDGLHPAVLRLIKSCCFAAARAGRPVSVCGSLGGDPLAVPVLIGLGVARLSVSAGRIAATKAAVRALVLDDCRQFAREACEMASPQAVREAVRTRWPELENWG
ncbi:phosphoenolpyruvate--protein phosphotransferase [Sphingomonas oryzagri]|uniref:phosphoenolpyruvate--protein phosphotransferase n=1 Tax=Sphingomonas oryzagri TaxID=3042314 RepID=A0ABT6MXL1_9SPHN|nr:phosphoenolpyruvate--protein phosphotransferase [Sphingomonas oryzagri]MDH7637780.1 phosphoenolpyruvate--protein phosphotransferase [Sphingomonas oryzagri]